MKTDTKKKIRFSPLWRRLLCFLQCVSSSITTNFTTRCRDCAL